MALARHSSRRAVREENRAGAKGPSGFPARFKCLCDRHSPVPGQVA